MNQQDTQPLYKVLDAVRTQKNWLYTDEFGIEVYDNTSNVIADFYQSNDDYIPEETKKANAQYAALAVNNLEKLVSALETAKQTLSQINTNGIADNTLHIITDALACIS